MKRTILIKTIAGNDSSIFILRNGRREKLSKCNLEIRIYQDIKDVPTLGGTGSVKTYHAAIAICSDINNEVDIKTLDACYFEIQTNIETGFQEYKRILLDRIALLEMDSLHEWTFEILDMDKIRHLLSV